MHRTVRHSLRWLTPLPLLIVVGCSSDDQRLVDLSRQSLDRQAEQNRLVETNNRQVLDATQKLVEADAQSRRENAQLEHELQTERGGVNQQRDALEQERRQIAEQRNRDPIVAESIKTAAGLIAAALPLLLGLFVLRGLLQKSDDEVAADVLVEELLTQASLFAAVNPLALLPEPQSQGDSRLTGQAMPRIQAAPLRQPKFPAVLVVVEGTNDAEFLRRMSRMLNKHDAAISSVGQLELDGRLAFLTASAAPHAFAQAAASEQFHLYDGEVPPATEERQRLVEMLNQRPHCRAVLTSKRAIENYLHADAVREAGDVQVSFGDSDDVAELVARASLRPGDCRTWESLSKRARRRLRDKAKKWLNREAVDCMTPERLAERDPNAEVIDWLRTIADLAAVDHPSIC
jgi:hypothetical protein